MGAVAGSPVVLDEEVQEEAQKQEPLGEQLVESFPAVAELVCTGDAHGAQGASHTDEDPGQLPVGEGLRLPDEAEDQQ